MADPGYILSGAATYLSRMRQRIQRGPVFAWRFMGPAPERLAMVPPDLRPNDPLVARDIYEGRFVFSGRVVETGGASPFNVDPPSEMWERRLHEFRWLRHLKGAESDLASANARALVTDWLQCHGRRFTGMAWQLDVTAARVIAWMQYSRLLLVNSDHDFYRKFMGSLARQVRYLRGLGPSMDDDICALRVHIALCIASLVLPTASRNERSAIRNLEFQLRNPDSCRWRPCQPLSRHLAQPVGRSAAVNPVFCVGLHAGASGDHPLDRPDVSRHALLSPRRRASGDVSWGRRRQHRSGRRDPAARPERAPSR